MREDHRRWYAVIFGGLTIAALHTAGALLPPSGPRDVRGRDLLSLQEGAR